MQRVQIVADALGDLREELVLVGGSAVGLLIDSAIAPPPRITYDVDLIAEVTALPDYHALEQSLVKRGFARDRSPEAPICRWIVGGVKMDLMPTTDAVLGFSNRWYAFAQATSTRCVLPSGHWINVISAPAFIATKLEAFDTRGGGDMMASHDFEDIINIVEGRSTLVDEIRSAAPLLRAFVVGRLAKFFADRGFRNALPGLIAPDELHAQRVAAVLTRIAEIAAL